MRIFCNVNNIFKIDVFQEKKCVFWFEFSTISFL